jgi:hypothetical protein
MANVGLGDYDARAHRVSVTTSLVYATTRHDEMGPIAWHAPRFGFLVVVVMAIVFVVFFAMSWWVSA